MNDRPLFESGAELTHQCPAAENHHHTGGQATEGRPVFPVGKPHQDRQGHHGPQEEEHLA